MHTVTFQMFRKIMKWLIILSSSPSNRYKITLQRRVINNFDHTRLWITKGYFWAIKRHTLNTCENRGYDLCSNIQMLGFPRKLQRGLIAQQAVRAKQILSFIWRKISPLKEEIFYSNCLESTQRIVLTFSRECTFLGVKTKHYVMHICDDDWNVSQYANDLQSRNATHRRRYFSKSFKDIAWFVSDGEVTGQGERWRSPSDFVLYLTQARWIFKNVENRSSRMESSGS